MPTELETQLSRLKIGDHLCLLHDGEEERRAAVVPFLRQGLQRGERCVHVHDASPAQITEWLEAGGVDVAREVAAGSLILLSSSEVFFSEGAFDAATTIALFARLAASAVEERPAGLRISSEMTWAVRDGQDPACVVALEAGLNELIPRHDLISMSQYDRQRFPAAVQRDMLRTHPLLVVDGGVRDNLYFEPSSMVLGAKDDAKRVSWMLAQLDRAHAAQRSCEAALAERDTMVEELKAERRRLKDLLGQIPAGVVIAGAPGGELLFANEKAHEIFGGRMPEPRSVAGYDGFNATHASGRPLLPSEYPLARSLRGESLSGQEHRIRTAGGDLRVLTANSAPLRDGKGEVVAAVAAFLDVTESKRHAAECDRLLQEMREADRRKDEFLAMLGHELRNPLGAVSNGLQVLRRRGNQDPGTRHERELIERQVKHMARLLDDLLDVSRITRGLTQLSRERLDLSGVVARAVATTSPLLQLRRHQLAIELPPEPLPVEGDGTRLEQVLVNLLSNAARYTEPGGRIWLNVQREEGQAVLRVRDSGVGIAPSLLPRIFDMFTQAERPLDRSQGGLGVGLTLARRLVELHGGSIEAASAGLGKGSEFTVRLPALVPDLSTVQRPLRPEVQHVLGAAKTILLVEDNVDAATMLYELLGMLGYAVHVAHDGDTALAMADKICPDVVLLDIGLPGMDGYEVARRLRQSRQHQDTLLVALTGYGQESDRRRSREAGFDKHLVKPVDVDELDRVIGASSRAEVEPLRAC